MLAPQILVHVVLCPEQTHLVGAVAGHGGCGTRPHATDALFPQDGGGTVDGILQQDGTEGLVWADRTFYL